MLGLVADGWFYISSAGLLISGVLFFFLLGQYRAACEAADVTEVAHVEAPVAAVHPVWVHDEPAHAAVASVAVDKSADAKPLTGTPAEKEPLSSVAGVSPAVVYLQNIKSELAEIHEEVRALAKRVDGELSAVSTRDEALIARLGELTAVVESFKPVAVPKPAAHEPISVQLGALIDAQPSQQEQPVVKASSPPPQALADPVVLEAPAEAKPRRGPVWPV